MSDANVPSAGPSAAALSGSSTGQAVLSFLETVGRPAEGEMYLRLFRATPRGRFALVLATREVIVESGATLVAQIAYLWDLGLFPWLLLAGESPLTAREIAPFRAALREAHVDTELIVESDGVDPAGLAEQAADRGALPIILGRDPPPGPGPKGEEGAAAPRGLLATVVALMKPRKVVVLRSRGGIGPHGDAPIELEPGHWIPTHSAGIGVINVVRDLEMLTARAVITSEERAWLDQAEAVLRTLSEAGVRSTTISFASPFSLLRELFTVKGEGTLVKLGSVIVRLASYADGPRERLRALLTESFGRELRDRFWERPPELVLVEEHFRGSAILERGITGSFLSKFAVLPVARGEGLGQDLWWEIRKQTPAFYWRSRHDNPINEWYRTVSDGMQRAGRWQIFWSGIDVADIPRVITDCSERPADFVD